MSTSTGAQPDNNNSIITTTNTNTTITSAATATKSNEKDFAAALFYAITTTLEKTEENVIISPFLIEAMLALIYLGCDGVSANELNCGILQLERFDNNSKMANYYCNYASNLSAVTSDEHSTPLTHIQLSNKILLRGQNCDIAEQFEKVAQKYFQTAINKCEVKNVESLQKYFSQAIAKFASPTNTNISETLLLQAAENESEANNLNGADADVAIVVNAILFVAANLRSKWFLPFSAYRSGYYDFHVNAAKEQTVPMLFDDDMFVKFAEFRELDARAIELPYEHDEELAMLLLLPNQRDGLKELTQKLQDINLLKLIENGMQMESVQVLVPKFKINFECGLRKSLEKLGISSIFTKNANFKNLLKENSKEILKISDILHKVCISVSESGSEDTNIVVNKPIVISNSIDSKKKFFRADHPFYFAIHDGRVTYFVGHVTKF